MFYLKKKVKRLLDSFELCLLLLNTSVIKQKLKEWLDKPSRALSYKKPIELISSESGAQTVLNLIGRMSYGVYS